MNPIRAAWDLCAAGWDRHTPQIRAWLAPATAAMLEIAGIAPGQRVLDVAAGAGDQTLDIAERVGPGGAVLATDLSPALVDLARARVRRAGCANVRVEVADGQQLGVDPASFDAALCRLGLMLFPDPLQGLREIYRALRPGARLCTLVFGRPERNPCVSLLMATALKHAGLPPRDPHAPGSLFSLGAPGRADALFREAGYDDVATIALDAPFRLPAARDYVEFVRASASPVVQILGRLDAPAAAAAWAEIEQRLEAYRGSEGWAGPNELLLTVGRRRS